MERNRLKAQQMVATRVGATPVAGLLTGKNEAGAFFIFKRNDMAALTQRPL